MPSPAVGGGAAVSKGLQIFSYALYLAASGGAAAVPANKLGKDSEPAAPWVRQGRLRDDSWQSNIGDPELFKGRAGWNRSVQFTAVRQAEDISFICRLDESDPDVIAKLRGIAATSLSSGSNLGQAFTYKTGETYGAKALLVGVAVDPNSTRERHIFASKATVTFKLIKEDDFEGIEARIEVADASGTETFQIREWN